MKENHRLMLYTNMVRSKVSAFYQKERVFLELEREDWNEGF